MRRHWNVGMVVAVALSLVAWYFIVYAIVRWWP